LASVAGGVNCIRVRDKASVAIGALTLAAVSLFVVDVLVLARGALQVVARVEAPAAPPERLRLVDFNVLHGYSSFPDQEVRAQRSIAALEALMPDIIVLQEAWRTRAHGDFVQQLADRLGMDSAFARANGKLERIGFEEGEAVLSRFPILRAERIELAPRKPFFERRVALVCVLDLGGELLTLVGTHLDHRKIETADAQAARLAARLSSLDAPILAGDLNAGDDSAAVEAFLAIGLHDLLEGGIDHVLFPHATSPWRVERADWTLRPHHVAALIGGSAEISDHPGIVVDLVRVGGAEPLDR
jgi:endonuclease/exonuclease/phosphatase family metal-dependent hydrolase